MLLSLVLILLLIWAAVVGSLYSNFMVFYKNFSETDSYNKAYYASIAALERWELVVKQREPGYIWSGWWRWTTEIVYEQDKIDSDFSYLVKSDDTNLFRDINSKTDRIPREWEWDVDWMLASSDSIDYNKMDYENAEVFLLYVDDLDDTPYTKKLCSREGDCINVPVIITWEIRLPPKMKPSFWDLNTTQSLTECSENNSYCKNDEIVDWQIRWKYAWEQFTIFARNKRDSFDSVIRESDINKKVKLGFWDNNKKRQPVKDDTKNQSSLIIISADDSIESTLKEENFVSVLDSNAYSRLNLRLSLLNLLKSTTSWMIYPYLEYYLSFTDQVADKYFKINAEWKYKDYQVNIIMHKPTVKESVLWNFTVIF